MRKAVLSILFTILCVVVFAQSHTNDACCRYGKGNVTGDCICPACKKEKDDKNKALQEEAKQNGAKAAAENAKKEAEIKKENEDLAKKKETEQKEKDKNAVYIEMPKTDKNNPSQKAEVKKEVEAKKEVPKTPEQKKVESLNEIERLKVEAMIAEMKRKQSQAAALEVEGDKFYQLGTLMMGQALKRYKQAQEIYYTYSVEQKIKLIEDRAALGQAVEKGMQKVDDFVEDVDPNRRTRLSGGYISYEGLLGDFNKIKNGYTQNPYSVRMGVVGHRLFFTFDMSFGYSQSPVYEYNVELFNRTNQTSQIINKVAIQQTSVGIGGGVGLNIPVTRGIAIYGLLGAELNGFTITKSIKSKGNYELADPPDFSSFKINKSVGIDFRIPKTGIGLGIRYNLNTIKGGENSGSLKNRDDRNDANFYYLKSTTDAIYEFNNFTIRLLNLF